MATGLLYGTVMVLTMRAKSMTASVCIVLACAFAFWSFYGAYKKSRAAGNRSFGELYDDLGFRFCLTPLVVMALVMVVAIKTGP